MPNMYTSDSWPSYPSASLVPSLAFCDVVLCTPLPYASEVMAPVRSDFPTVDFESNCILMRHP
eukprot:1334207-Amorphochlora_amoeboformis.AAC.3